MQANSGFTNKKLRDQGYFGSGIYATSIPDYAALYPTEIKQGAAPNADHEYCVIGALGLLGKVRPIVQNSQDYPDGPDHHCRFHGAPLDKGYHTHYVSVDASGGYEAFRESSESGMERSKEEHRADEFVFANDSQLHPNLLIYFKPRQESSSDSSSEDTSESEEADEEDHHEMDEATDASDAQDDEEEASAPAASPGSSLPSSTHSFPASLMTLQPSQEKELGGSGSAQLLIDPLSKQQYVLKYVSCAPIIGAEISRATMESIANRIYARMGVRVPEVCLYDPDSKQQVPAGSVAAFSAKSLLLLVRFLPGTSSVQQRLAIPTRMGGRSLQLDDPVWRSRVSPPGDLYARLQSIRFSVKDGFLVDCLLANWDVCGWMFDNLVVDDETGAHVWRLDQGACCIYRAKGALKSADKFNEVVAELTNRRTAKLNPNAHLLYANLSSAEVQKQVQHLSAHKQHILDLLPPGTSALRRTMEGRLEYILSGKWQSAWTESTDTTG